jgi:hypothetical protein
MKKDTEYKMKDADVKCQMQNARPKMRAAGKATPAEQ